MEAADRRELQTPSFTLRPATESDFSFIHALRRAGLREYVDQIWGWDESSQLSRFRARFDPALYVVIVIDGSDVGAMAVEWRSEEAFLSDIYICQERQRQGLGTAVLSSLVSQAQQRGLPVSLKVLKNNPARRLYERLGFRLENETETHYWLRAGP